MLLKLSPGKLKLWFILWGLFLQRLLFISINLTYGYKPTIRICRTSGTSLPASPEPLAHRRNVATLSLFCRYYFSRCSSEVAQLVPLPYSWGRSTRYSNRLHDFSVGIPRCYKDVYVSFVSCTAELCSSLPIECFPLTHDLYGFKSRINRYLSTIGSF